MLESITARTLKYKSRLICSYAHTDLSSAGLQGLLHRRLHDTVKGINGSTSFSCTASATLSTLITCYNTCYLTVPLIHILSDLADMTVH